MILATSSSIFAPKGAIPFSGSNTFRNHLYALVRILTYPLMLLLICSNFSLIILIVNFVGGSTICYVTYTWLSFLVLVFNVFQIPFLYLPRRVSILTRRVHRGLWYLFMVGKPWQICYSCTWLMLMNLLHSSYASLDYRTRKLTFKFLNKLVIGW